MLEAQYGKNSVVASYGEVSDTVDVSDTSTSSRSLSNVVFALVLINTIVALAFIRRQDFSWPWALGLSAVVFILGVSNRIALAVSTLLAAAYLIWLPPQRNLKARGLA
jgi:hypothetical protein